jgi:hypothetical protein
MRNSGWLVGSVANNTVTGNRTGITLTADGPGPPVPIDPLEPQDLRIAGNLISGQILFAAACPGPGPCPADSDGTGVVFSGDDGAMGAGTAGTLDGRFILERNRIFNNQRHGAWMRIGLAASNVSPLLRNNRIYGNGTIAMPATGNPGDGVRIDPGGLGGTLAPTLVHETIWGNLYGYGVNNVAGAGQPRIWNSIIYSNGTGALPVASDLFGFAFGTNSLAAPGPSVDYSDFCGAPWLPGTACGSGPPTGPIAGCITAPPFFVAPAAPNFEPTCGLAPCSPEEATPCCPPSCLSACIDAGSPTAPFLPPTDANGATRTVDLNGGGALPDMGAIEKQACSP